jgi:hypothetical protein
MRPASPRPARPPRRGCARLATPGLAALALVALAAPPAAAHGMRSAHLQLEAQGGAATARLRTPAGALAAPRVDGCPVEPLATGAAPTPDAEGSITRAFIVRCAALVGARITVTGLGGELDEAVVLVRDERGREHTAVLTGDADALVVPATATALATARSYVGHGLRHIATGLDHLLLLVLLVLQLRRLRPILIAETAFSISHGLAFAATALGWVHLPPAPVEACIAVSLILLALDVGRPARPRAVALLALAFGLVHGLGFAGGLRELGVPDAHAAAAILGFGLGVELGQLACVLGAWAAITALTARGRAPRLAPLATWLTVGAGGIATFWLIDRARAVLEAP